MNSNELAEQLSRLESLLKKQADEYDQLDSDIEDLNKTIKDATASIQDKTKRKAALVDSVEAGKVSMSIINTFVKQSLLKADVGVVLDDLRSSPDPDYTTAYTILGIQSLDDREGEEEQMEIPTLEAAQ